MSRDAQINDLFKYVARQYAEAVKSSKPDAQAALVKILYLMESGMEARNEEGGLYGSYVQYRYETALAANKTGIPCLGHQDQPGEVWWCEGFCTVCIACTAYELAVDRTGLEGDHSKH